MNNIKLNIKKGDKVYIKELDQFGIVEEVTPTGLVTKVRVKTPTGEEVINTLHLAVTIARIVEKGLLPALRAIVIEIKSWFHHKKSE